MRALAGLIVMTMGGCLSSPSIVEVSTPQALSCARIPRMRAELFVSGVAQPCLLDVDINTGTTTGSCDIPTGLVRTVVIEWLTDVEGVRVVLAQVRRDVDVTNAGPETPLAFTDDDIITEGCLDVSGATTQRVDGRDALICDLDNDDVSNVVESCSGSSPLGGL
jgi:hypothetical protein